MSALAPGRPGRWVVALTRVALAATIAFIAYCLLWQAQGGRWERVETPSMGTRAPVGSLLWVEPVDFDTLREGDFITFRPPSRPPGASGTYSHLVVERHDDGTLSTQGVLPGRDPWRLTEQEVVGQVRHVWWGVGWLVVAAPVLLVGGLVVTAVRSLLRRRWRAPATLVLGSLVVSIAITVHQPFVDAEQLGFVADPGGGAEATYVGTGLLPIRLEAPSGRFTVLGAGEVGSVHVERADEQGRLSVLLSPEVPLWWWVALVLACFVPALGATAQAERARVRRRRGTPGRASAAGCHRRPRAACP